MNEAYFEYNIDDIIKKLKKGPYDSKRDLLYTSSLGVLCFYAVLHIQKLKGNNFDTQIINNMALQAGLIYGALGNLFIRFKRNEHTKDLLDSSRILDRFLNSLETLNINASQENVVESIKEKTKYHDIYYLFDYAGDLQMVTKTELSKKKKGMEQAQYKKEELDIKDPNLELIDQGIRTDEVKKSFREIIEEHGKEIKEVDNSYPYYRYKLTYNLDKKDNMVDFYLDKNRVRIIETEGPISELKDQFKYINLKLALQATKEKDNMRMYEDAFKSKIIKKYSRVD